MAVLGFTATGLTQLEAQVLTDRFVMELEKTNAVQALVSRETAEEIISERGLADDTCRSDSCVIEIANMLGVEFVVRGKVISDAGWYTFEIDLFSVEKKKAVEERKVFWQFHLF
ncbi:MAG: hypothetical protein QF842_02750 [Candidatus Marinimicrobia bacterium]|jgi:hypothetical protein|nr:hypothetical protein [Candidatus Neomarinimicrobiota bacterium]MDP6612166.1 hypothetical protein [Candidatus Neomarinimicrobiota bacterium]|tara:strand:- start:35981 stop:36322 length:342 start_codon:yes stop_codon:yes gene_type:complete